MTVCEGPVELLATVPAPSRVPRPRPRPEPPAREHDAAVRACWLLSPDASSVPQARRLTRAQLADWALHKHIDDTELLVSELVTNALRHAWGPIRLTLARFPRHGVLRCEVEDTEPDPPSVCRAGEEDERGRGMQLLDVLSRRWGSDRTPVGKIVWFELHAPTGPAGA
ncbi:ATP-binding protein [Streptomyces sp. NPDC004647]|uniref:ATP-binding protein n=1 Tax=Streptomyces sp. NPDC004647 TaxID=3154671 RepID=UPI0033B601EF